MDFALLLSVFLTIFVVELPDKTFIATLVLATRYRPLWVWLGVSAAFLVQTAVAIGFGSVISRLPETPVHVVVLLVFLVAGILMLRGAADADAEEAETEREVTEKSAAAGGTSPWKAISTSFVVLFVAEWGDLSQLATAGFVARQGHPVSVFLGAFGALLAVSGLAALLGRALLQRLRLSTIRRIGGTVCLVIAAVMVAQLAGVELPAWIPL